MTHDIFLKGFSDWSFTRIVADVNIMGSVLSVHGFFSEERLNNMAK